jgi:hypothetical protein
MDRNIAAFSTLFRIMASDENNHKKGFDSTWWDIAQ